MNCSEFLDDYSSYRDGLADAGRRAAFEVHIGECESCARYDRVVASGVEIARTVTRLEPSPDFIHRLQHRIYHVEDEMRASRRVSSGTSLAFTIAIAAAIGVSAWLPAMRPAAPVVVLPPVLAQAPPRTDVVPSIFRAGPLLSPSRSGGIGTGREPTVFFRYTPLGIASGEPAPAILTAQPLRHP